MKLALMQPYFFPYLGYFSLVAAVDRFVFYDDVQYIKNGWINRNVVRIQGRDTYITVPLVDAGSSRRIDDVEVRPAERWAAKMLESLRHGYGRAPYYAAVSALVGDVLHSGERRIAEMAKASVTRVAGYLGLPTSFEPSSRIYGNDALRGPERVLDICRRESASEYYNLPGGRELYDDRAFADAGVALRFVAPVFEPYPQFGAPFRAGLSIIDVLMHNSPQRVRVMALQGTGG
jgi:hypothetical protein